MATAFKKAWQKARDAGKGIFWYNGKYYNTMNKDEEKNSRSQFIKNHSDLARMVNAGKSPVDNMGMTMGPDFNLYDNVDDNLPYNTVDLGSDGKMYQNWGGWNTGKVVGESGINELNKQTQYTPTVQETAPQMDYVQPQLEFNRSQTRDWMRARDINPYSYNGAQRRALRMVLNGTADDDDKNIVRQMNIQGLKLQQGGQVSGQQQQVQQQVIKLVQAAMQGDKKAQQQVQQIMEAAKGGDEQAAQIAQMIQQVVEAMQKQARSAKIGAKLAYIHKLRTGANPDEAIIFERHGGQIVKKKVKRIPSEKEPQEAEQKQAPAKKTYFQTRGGKACKVSKKCYFGGTL